MTKENSSAIIKIGHKSIIRLGENTRINIFNILGEGKILIKIKEGVVRHKLVGPGEPEVFVSTRTYGNFYSAPFFDAVLKGPRFFFRPGKDSKVYKFNRSRLNQGKQLSLSKRKIDLLIKQEGRQKSEQEYKENHEINDEDFMVEELDGRVSEDKTLAPVPPSLTESSLQEASDIFGDSAFAGSSTTEAGELFGDLAESNTDLAEDIFGVEVEVKSENERRKMRDNIGVKLEENKIDSPLPKIVQNNSKGKKLNKMDLSLFSKTTVYPNKPREDVGKIDDQSFHQDVRLTASNKYKISTSESLAFSAWLDAGNRKDVYNDIGDVFDLQSNKRNYLYLNELYYTFSTQDYDVQFGKKIIKTGKGIIYSPSDSFTAVDATVPTSPVFLGNFMVGVDYYFGGWTLSTIFLPAIVPNKSPDQNSRWSTLYSDINFDLKQEFPSTFSLKTRQLFLKLEGTKFGTDWQFSFFNGPNTIPVIRNEITVDNNVPTFNLIQEHVPITFVSLGFSTTFGGLELHGEFLSQNASEGKDDSFDSMMVGFRYVLDEFPKRIGLNTIDIIIEHGRENLRSRQSRPFYALSSIGSRFYQNSWVGTTIFNVNDEISFNYDFHLDKANKGSAAIISGNYSTASSQWRVKYESYTGEDTSNFGIWDNNDNLSLEFITNW